MTGGSSTITELLEHTVRQHAARTALVALDTGGAVARSVSFAELADEVARATAGLRRLGLARGDAIALWLPNGIEWTVLAFAANRLGALVVPLNTRYKTDEARHLVRTGGARMLVYEPAFHGIDFDGMAAALDPGLELVTVGARRDGACLYDDLLGEPVDDAAGAPGDPAIVFGTSGTTSAPKLALHPQLTVARHAEEVAAALPLTPDDVVLGLLPPCGAYGYVTLTAALAGGATTVLLPAFDDGGIL